MKKLLGFLVIMVGITGAAHAESVQGSIVSVDRSSNTIVIDPSGNPLPGSETPTGHVELRLADSTQFSGIGGLQELEIGDQISVEAMRPSTGDGWQIQTLSLAGAPPASTTGLAGNAQFGAGPAGAGASASLGAGAGADSQAGGALGAGAGSGTNLSGTSFSSNASGNGAFGQSGASTSTGAMQGSAGDASATDAGTSTGVGTSL
jgi:hypothetical protein